MQIYFFIQHTCKQNTLNAGIGRRAAARNAITLHSDAKSTLSPLFFSTRPVRSSRDTSACSTYACVNRNISCTPSPSARNGTICVLEALNGIPGNVTLNIMDGNNEIKYTNKYLIKRN